MVEHSRIVSAQWAVATRLGSVYQQAKQFTKLPPRVPRLLVPVDLQALVVPAGGSTGAGRGDIRSRMLDAQPEERLPPPFSTAPDLPPGVHLHWSMPDGLTKGRPAEPGTTERDLRMRPLPDRWLVCRLSPAPLGRVRPTASWVLHSDSAEAVPLKKWDPARPGDPATTLRPGQFTAATGGDLGWAAIYDNVVDRLAFHDDLADLTGPAVLAYVVVGWYDDAALDPLHPPTDPASLTALLGDLGWDVDLSALPAVEEDLVAVDAHLVSLAKQAGLEFDDGEGPPGSKAAKPTQPTQPPLGLDDLVLNADVAVHVVANQPRVTSSLYHGTLYGVQTGGGGVDERPGPATPITLTLGSTGVDVLSRLLAGADPVAERMLDAFSYGTLRDYSSDDGVVTHDEAVHRNGFAVLPDPSPGVSEKFRDPVTDPPIPPAFGGTKGDHVVGLGTRKDASLKIVFADSWQDAQQLTLAAVEAAQGLTFAGPPPPVEPTPPGPVVPAGPAATSTRATPAPTYSRVVRPNPRWYAPTEPVLAIRGANRSLRHGYDGRFDPGEKLACRLTGQPVRGYADLLSGRAVVAPLGHGGLPSECDDLVREASLSDPNAIEHLASVVSPGLGWTKTQVKNRLAAEMVLDVHLAARQGDVAELLGASIKDGTEPSPVGITYWRQPWIPVYAEWRLTLATTDSATGWQLGEIDLDPRTGDRAPQPGRRTLAGRSLLNSSSARNLATAVDQFLAAEDAADEAGQGIISAGDAQDLAALALSAARSDVLVGSLQGINDHFLGFDTDAAFARPEDDDPITSPTRLPELLRAGWLRLDELRLVDAYGRVLDLSSRLNAVALADALETTTAIPPGVPEPASSPPAHLPPRLTTPSRLQLRFLDAADDAREARVDESTPATDRNPVAGWLLPDHGDDALEFFDAAGTALGQLFHRGFRSAVTWEGAPGRAGPLGAGPAGDLAGSVHLARLAVALVQRDAAERAAGLTPGESPLGALLRAVDTTLWSADPVGAAGTAPVSVLVGRPIAVVRVRVRMDLYDDSRDYALSPADIAARQAAFGAAAERGLTVRLGALSRFDDGVLGFYLDDDYSVFHPVHAAVRELARQGGPQHGFLDQVEAAAAYGETLDPEPIVAPYLEGDPDLTVRPGRDMTLTVLMLAGLGINATCGLVPRKRLELNRSWTDAALQKLLPSFRVGPVLVDPGQIRMPRISAVPDDTGGGIQSTWTRRDTPVTWREDPILAASMTARLVDHPAVAHEGWVRLVPAEDD